MALSGSLDSFALPDVMRLLASTNKTGRLRVSGDRGSGSVWVEDGEIVASELTTPPTANPSHAEVLFALLRFASGSFSFESDSRSVKATSPEQVEPILVSSEHMMIEWRAIEQVVPSLDVYVELASDLGGSDVMVDAARWRCIAAVGGGSTVGEVGTKLEQAELEICRTVKELVELGLLIIGEAPAPPEPAPPEPEPVFEPEPEPEPVLEHEPEPEPAAGIGAESETVEDESFGERPVEPAASAHADSAGFEPEPIADEAHVQAGSLVAESEAGFEAEGEAHFDSIDDLADPGVESGSVVHTAPGLAGLGSPVEPGFDPDALTDPTQEMVTDDFQPDGDPGLVPDGSMPDEIGGGSPVGNEGGGLFGGATQAESEAGELDPAEMARQLANLSPKAAKAVAAAAKASTEAEREAALAAVEAEDDTVDRGLLLKFLGSVDT